MKKKIVYIAPHLSTGGMPQYLVKQIESIKDDMDVYCIEWENVTGGVLVVQRNKMVNLLGDRLITLGENKNELVSILNTINPDVVHLQEIPELFMPKDIADTLYSTNRKYILIETSHDSGYNVDNKLYLPDKFLMVSQYQIDLYKKLDIPCDLVEYPIESKVRTKTREAALLALGLDPNLKHVINVGLFTPRKNQAEVMEYARVLQHYPIQFHFIGNQAENFKHYWEPLMQNFPKNCKWWGERTDVDSFYEAADLFLFTSRGHATDMETMPLVIREALGWKVPSLIYNLPVYQGYFDKYDTIEYLAESTRQNAYRIAEKLLRENTSVHINENVFYGEQMKSTHEIFPMKNTIQSRWDLDSQTMYFSTTTTIDFPIIVTLREYKSEGVFWSCEYDSLASGVEYWMIPIQKHVHSYVDTDYFSGVKLCIYRKDTEEQIYEMPYFHTFANVPTVMLSNSIPYHLNYREYYLDHKADKWISKPHGLIVDVGANVGVFTKYMIDTGYARQSVAVECDPKALKDLNRNFRRSSQVTIVPKALHSTNEPITFYHSPENPIISSTLSPDQLKMHMAGVKGDVRRIVDTVTIKDLVDMYGVIDLLKIDIEGAEYSILESCSSETFTNIKSLLIECHFFEETSKEKYRSLVGKLRSIGYIVDELSEERLNSLSGASDDIYAYKI